MVTVASDFLIMLNGKWSSQKFQDEQINELYLNDSILKETKILKISNNV
jgi:hypothetical protein